METISGKTVKNLLKRRRKRTYKGTYGKVLIVAGSEGMAGAAVLAARGALRAGSGLVGVSIDKKLFTPVQSTVVEATCIDRDLTVDVLKEYDSLVVGPGLGSSEEAIYTVSQVLYNFKGNMVLDADALNIIGDNKIDLFKAKGNLILTPHLGEASKLIHSKIDDIKEEREKVVSYLSESTGAVAILKGYETLVCLPRKNKNARFDIFRNTTGNPGMATGGSGDVLSGIIGSFLGQGMKPADAAFAGVYIHGLAGDLASKDVGEYGVIAGDIALYTAYAIKKIQE